MAKRKKKQRRSLATAQSMMLTEKAIANFPSFMELSNQYTSPRRGTKELLELFSQSPWLRAVTGKIARSVADIEWIIAAKKGENGRFVGSKVSFNNGEAYSRDFGSHERGGIDLDKLEVIPNHPMLELFRKGTGNTRLNGFQVFQVTQEHIDLTGEAFWLLEKDKLGIPSAIWPLPPHWVKNLPTRSKPFYEVTVSSGLTTDVPVTEIVPFIDPNPHDPFNRGSGISSSLDDEIQVDEYAAKHQKSFFLNRARPDIIISGQNISKSDTTRLENKWLADHQGFWKAFKPLFFSQKIDVKELTQTFESMQMTQIRKFERDTFVSVFGVPPEKLGIIGESKRSTIAAADFFWNKDIIKPRVEMMRRAIQSVLVPMFDERLILTYKTPVVQDDEHKLKVMERAPWAATINEWRKEQGLPSLGAAGDVIMAPLNNQAVPVMDENGNLIDQATFLDSFKAPEASSNDSDNDDNDEDDSTKYIETDHIIDGLRESLSEAFDENEIREMILDIRRRSIAG